MTSLHIARRKSWLEGNRPWDVMVDGTYHGPIAPGGAMHIQVTPGPHIVSFRRGRSVTEMPVVAIAGHSTLVLARYPVDFAAMTAAAAAS